MQEMKIEKYFKWRYQPCPICGANLRLVYGMGLNQNILICANIDCDFEVGL